MNTSYFVSGNFAKKAVSLWILLCLGGSVCLAQEQKDTTYHKFSIGIKGGVGFSSVFGTGENISRTSPSIDLVQGYLGGLSLQYFAESNFALQVEGYLIRKGWRQKFVGSDDLFTDSIFYETTLNYAEFPITAHAYFGRKNLRLFADAGVYLAYMFSYDDEREVSVQDSVITYRMNRPDVNRLDIGLIGGAGFEVASAAGTFQLGSSLRYGLGSVLDKNLQEIPNILQNFTVAITLGYYVEFGRK